MPRKVIGYHGTLLSHAEAMARDEFDGGKDRGKQHRWLGRGLYFFEDNPELATSWALRRAAKEKQEAGVLRAEIDLSSCLDLTRAGWRQIVIEAQDLAERRGDLKHLNQKPLTINDGQVMAGFDGEWSGYGRNVLDFKVMELSVALAREKYGVELTTVRSFFLEGKEIYRSSFVFSDSSPVIAVRDPRVSLSDLRVIAV